MLQSGYLPTKRLAVEKPQWIPILECIVELVREFESQGFGKEFCGSWVLNKAVKKGIKWFPGLRTLVAYGILQKTYTTRGGRRAYYIMPDIEGVEKALQEIKGKL
jgi:hypothetical protein